MDPIERLLSDLTPARASSNLDTAMDQMFDRAERRARWFRLSRIGAALATALAVGLGAGFRWGQTSANIPTTETITYVVPMDAISFLPVAQHSVPKFFDTRRESPEPHSASIAVTVLEPSDV